MAIAGFDEVRAALATDCNEFNRRLRARKLPRPLLAAGRIRDFSIKLT